MVRPIREYPQAHSDGYGYTQYVAFYNEWSAKPRVVMRQVHKAGEKCFVDYSGKKPTITDPSTGERVEVELFVAVMGASNFTYKVVLKGPSRRKPEEQETDKQIPNHRL